MLSRIAESLFWIGRYVERADNTARILDVHIQSLSEDPWASEDLALRTILTVMDRSVPADGSLVTRARAMQTLAHDQLDPSSIAGSMIAARENARRARETVSSELWECLNTTRNQVSGPIRLARPHDFFAWVRERAAIVTGIVESSTSHDDAWLFMMLGRSIERADMTARLVQTQAQLGETGPGWTTLLRSAGAYEAFLRTFRGVTSDEKAAEFLLLDRLFPRSVVHALDQAEDCLRQLEPAADRRGVTNEARRALSRMRADLEYAPLPDTLADLSHVMERVQRSCAAASDATKARYFPDSGTTTWMEEAL